jgi:hypothetical protein
MKRLTPDNIRDVSVEDLFEHVRMNDYKTEGGFHKLSADYAFIEIRRRLVALEESSNVLLAFRDRINKIVMDVASAEYWGNDLTDSVRKEIETLRVTLTSLHDFMMHDHYDFSNGNTDSTGTVDEGVVMGYSALHHLDNEYRKAMHLPEVPMK